MLNREPVGNPKGRLAMITNFNKHEQSINKTRRLTTMDTKRLANFRANKLYQ